MCLLWLEWSSTKTDEICRPQKDLLRLQNSVHHLATLFLRLPFCTPKAQGLLYHFSFQKEKKKGKKEEKKQATKTKPISPTDKAHSAVANRAAVESVQLKAKPRSPGTRESNQGVTTVEGRMFGTLLKNKVLLMHWYYNSFWAEGSTFSAVQRSGAKLSWGSRVHCLPPSLWSAQGQLLFAPKKGSAGDTAGREKQLPPPPAPCAALGTRKAELCLLIRPHVRQIDISVSEQITFKASKGQLEVKWHCAYPQPFPGQPHTPDLCWSHLPTAHSAKDHGNSYPRC